MVFMCSILSQKVVPDNTFDANANPTAFCLKPGGIFVIPCMRFYERPGHLLKPGPEAAARSNSSPTPTGTFCSQEEAACS